MSGRELATTGMLALALLYPAAMRAQLSDAPSPGKFGMGDWQLSRQPRTSDTSPSYGPLTELGYSAAAPEWSLYPLAEDYPGQQSLYTPRKTNLGPQFSSGNANTRPIPGPGPQLYNACPQNTCSSAQSIMCCGSVSSPFARYLKNPSVVPLTTRDNLHSAIKDIIDPFNLLTIVADAAIGIGTDSHSPYGPGVQGISKYAGVSMTEDLTGEFFGTFLVPSLMHQDPHYHREPFMPIRHRLLHAVVQVVWTKSYDGRGMLNYANILGGIATAAVSNTFVPGPGRQGWGNTAQRLSVAFATSPSGNLITEFVPDLASHINLRVVIFQRILNSVSNEEGGGP
jgi:hypothetical protein